MVHWIRMKPFTRPLCSRYPKFLYYVIFRTISYEREYILVFHVKYCKSVSLQFPFFSFLQVKWAASNWCCTSTLYIHFTWQFLQCLCLNAKVGTEWALREDENFVSLISMKKHFWEIFFRLSSRFYFEL